MKPKVSCGEEAKIAKGQFQAPNLNPSNPITKAEVDKFVSEDSDFGFEMSVLAELRTLGFECSHSGTYSDPVTKKIRQFDLRATIERANCKLALAVECKNLRSPLLISAVPRTPKEAFHSVIEYVGENSVYHSPVECTEVAHGTTVYGANESVGKKTDQIRRENAKLVSDDSAMFDKIGQAINSAEDLIREMANEEEKAPPFRVVVPVLVVPMGLLWQADYDANGRLVVEARAVNRSTCYVDHGWRANVGIHFVWYRISHLEIIASNYLSQALKEWMGDSGFFRGYLKT
jgi:hypothetical protein